MSGLHRNPRQPRLHVGARALAAVLLALSLAACAGVRVDPSPRLPQPLVQPMTARVGLVLEEELRRYQHEETRGGTNWKVALGPGHEEFFRTVMQSSFSTVEVFPALAGARGASGLQALFRPQIEQFSFATDKETGGEYWAVTIRYRIAVLAPDGDPVDYLTLTGYGSTRGGRAGSALTAATRSAMRDAAAKFLVQMPRLPLADKLRGGQALSTDDAPEVQVDIIEVVPIEEPGAP